MTAEEMCTYIVQMAQKYKTNKIAYGKLVREYGPEELFNASPTGELFHMFELYWWAQSIDKEIK